MHIDRETPQPFCQALQRTSNRSADLFSKDIFRFWRDYNRAFFDFSLQSIKDYGYTIDEVTYDLYSLNDEDNVPTEYEEKFNALGTPINRLKAHKD